MRVELQEKRNLRKSCNKNSMKILLIEDDREIGESLVDGLGQFGFSVYHVVNFAQAKRSVTNEEFGVIILDWMLPDGEGPDMCNYIRDYGIETPILMLTARTEVQDRVTGLNSGADDYLAKPFAFQELLARIRALRRRQKVVVPTVITVSDLSLDTQQMLVKRGDQTVSLAPKEYQLLEYLARNPNQVLAKYQILEHVWLDETDAVANTVEVFIGYLRKKIDRAFPDSPPLLHTVRGSGYIFGERS